MIAPPLAGFLLEIIRGPRSIPMPMPDGASPPFAWTLQPGGAHFEPPIALEYPNMSGLPAGAIAYFLSFNHDTERFEIVASGHVGPDGSTITSDPKYIRREDLPGEGLEA